MADEVDSLTDADLQTKLTEYGFPKVPVTAATRKILAKKLKSILDNKNKHKVHKKDEHEQSLSCSSTEKDHVIKAPIKDKEKYGRRITIGTIQDTPTSKIRKQARCKDSNALPNTLDQLDSMTDADLQSKLAEHGYPLMPVTVATRGILEKKLKLILENKSNELSNEENKKDTKKRSLGKDPKIEQHNLVTITKNKSKRGRSTLTSEDVMNSERPNKMSRLSAHSSTFTSLSTITSNTANSIKSSTEPLMAKKAYTSDPRATIHRVEHSPRNSSTVQSNFTEITDLGRGNDKTSQSFFEKRKTIFENLDFANLIPKFSMSKTSLVSNYSPNITLSTHQPERTDLDYTDSPFVSDFGRRLHAEKCKSKT